MAPTDACVCLSSSLSVTTDVHPNHHTDYLPQPVGLRVPGDALHAQGVHHPLPPGSERTQA